MKPLAREELVEMIRKSRLADNIEKPANEIEDFQVFSLEHLKFLLNRRFGMEEERQ
jgi:hypothetical protein